MSSGGGGQPSWRRDGQELYYLARDRRLMSVAVDTGTQFRAGPSVLVFRVPSETASEGRIAHAATADADRFLINLVAPDQARLPVFQAHVVLNWLSTIPRRGGDP